MHPGFMTDWQQPLVVALTQASGLSIVHETVYENRFGFTDALRRDGRARSRSTRECLGGLPCRFGQRNFQHSAVISGPTPLHGADIEVPDLRGGFSHLIAALAAEGDVARARHRPHRPRLRALPAKLDGARRGLRARLTSPQRPGPGLRSTQVGRVAGSRGCRAPVAAARSSAPIVPRPAPSRGVGRVEREQPLADPQVPQAAARRSAAASNG